MAERNWVRGVAACLLLTALVSPARVAEATPEPDASPGPAQAGLPTGIDPRIAVPGLRPDPDLHPSNAPGESGPGRGPQGPGGPGNSAQPTREERDALVARVAPYGVRPVLDEAGAPALTVDRELVLSGGSEGLEAMRAAGMELAPGPRAGVSAVHAGGRIVAWYVIDEPVAPTAEESSSAPPSPPPGSAPDSAAPESAALPKTGPRALVPLAVCGAFLVICGVVVVRIAARWRSRT